jgi:hypothetical protein
MAPANAADDSPTKEIANKARAFTRASLLSCWRISHRFPTQAFAAFSWRRASQPSVATPEWPRLTCETAHGRVGPTENS